MTEPNSGSSRRKFLDMAHMISRAPGAGIVPIIRTMPARCYSGTFPCVSDYPCTSRL